MIVVDSSVAFKWLKSENEPLYDKAFSLLQRHLNNKSKILVPHLLFLEIANALVTKTLTTRETVKTDLQYLYKINLEVYSPTEKDILSSARLAKKYQTTVYDMLYAVIAKNEKATLITADERFIQKTGFKFVKYIKDL